MKTIDLIFCRSLNDNGIFQLISSDRITTIDTDELTDTARCSVVKQFITSLGIANPNTPDIYPDAVLEVLNNIIGSAEVTPALVNKSFSILRSNGYAIFMVDRIDLTEAVEEGDYALKAMILNNAVFVSEIIEAYSGKALLYEEENKLSASTFDFIEDFNLDQEELKSYNLSSAYNSYLVLKKEGRLSLANDYLMRRFLEATQWKYVMIFK